jgi:hypothetical protein
MNRLVKPIPFLVAILWCTACTKADDLSESLKRTREYNKLNEKLAMDQAHVDSDSAAIKSFFDGFFAMCKAKEQVPMKNSANMLVCQKQPDPPKPASSPAPTTPAPAPPK